MPDSSDDSKLNDDTIEKISKEFGISIEHIKILENAYGKLVDDIPYQFLAHMIRTLEAYIRSKGKKYYFFRITCTPVKPEECTKGLASGFLDEKKFCCYDIYYDGTADQKQIRAAIAHELGHLFCLIELNKFEERYSESFSNTFGVIVMVHKLNLRLKKPSHKSEDDIVSDFLLLANKKRDVFNIS